MSARFVAWASIAFACGCSSSPSSAGPPDAADDTAVRTDATLDGEVDAREGAETGDSTGSCSLEATWSPLTVTTVVDALDHGAIGDGTTDDLHALQATVDALPANGGIVWIAPAKTFRKTDLLTITTPHVKFWSPNRAGGIFGAVLGVRRKQAILCRADGCGFFGVKLSSDATTRFDAAEDNQITIDHHADAEIVGVEITGSAAVGVFLYGSTRTFVEGNFVHDTYADHIHHTDGARQSWCWENWMRNGPPSNGDDGIACVTYGPTSPKCGDMEWFSNTMLRSGWGRGYSVIGGDHISIHDNWAIEVAGAGLIVGSEPPSSSDSASSDHVVEERNHLYRCGQVIDHPGILVSGENPGAPPLSDLSFVDNVVVETKNGQPYRAEGAYTAVDNSGMSTNAADLPSPIPTDADVTVRDTSTLATRDVAWVDAAYQRGLHRVHVRKGSSGFEQRFEYVVQGGPGDLESFLATLTGACTVESRVVGGRAYALVLVPRPIVVPASIDGVTFEALRAGDNDGSLHWLWARIDARQYD